MTRDDREKVIGAIIGGVLVGCFAGPFLGFLAGLGGIAMVLDRSR